MMKAGSHTAFHCARAFCALVYPPTTEEHTDTLVRYISFYPRTHLINVYATSFNRGLEMFVTLLLSAIYHGWGGDSAS